MLEDVPLTFAEVTNLEEAAEQDTTTDDHSDDVVGPVSEAFQLVVIPFREEESDEADIE